MTELPRVSVFNCASALLKLRLRLKRQQGKHLILRRDDPFAQVVVPDHSELDTGTLRSILRQESITPQQFLDAL